jgi:exopolysaccharide biosynthesis operon protein EpsL
MNQRKNRATKHHRWRWQASIFLNVALLPILSLASDDETTTNNVVDPFVAIEYGNNSNLLGLPNIATAQAMGAGSSLSDNWRKWQAGILIDEKYSLQELMFKASAAQTDFDRLQQLDHIDKDASLDWNWSVSPELTGQVGFSYDQGLTPYIDFHLLALNMRTQSSEHINLAWLVEPSWRIRAGFTNYHLDYELPAQQIADRTEERTNLGLDYLAPSGSSVGLQFQNIDAYFPVSQVSEFSNGMAVGNNYTQDEAKLKIDWLATAITQVHFLGGWVRRDYDTFTSRDYSGPNWRLTVDWQPEPRLSFTGAVWREIDSVDDLTAAYSLNHGIDAEAKWEISDKTRLEGKYQYIRENFGENQLLEALPFQSGDVRLLSIVGTYKVTRKFQLLATFARILQNQYDPSSGFSGNSIALQARYDFGL